ncbi:DegT family aminotransferase [Helicobacter mustelae]|nr:DegT/DnrJ/EryC1/StrS family aminotransferase [Helicobacter mustelae]SQH71430.1 DegT family aminotransferase [Helicobacter mustelae]
MIDFSGIKQDYQAHQKEIDAAIARVIASGQFIMGEEIEALEKKLSKFVGVRHALSCSSGTSALILCLLALGIGKDDEVITSSFSFFASAEAIAIVGARPVFVDIDESYNLDISKIRPLITKKTRAILAVSLFGQMGNLPALLELAKQENLWLIEDGAQSFGASYEGKKSGSIAHVSTTSFFPAKPLGCFGDGGAIFCNDEGIYHKLKLLRTHGQSMRYQHEIIGMNARLDSLQAAILQTKLGYYEQNLAKRQENARLYCKHLKDAKITLPFIDRKAKSSFAQFSILCKLRESLREFLQKRAIPTAVHYPIALHQQKAFGYLPSTKAPFAEQCAREILSLPLHPYLTPTQILTICQSIKEFYG